METRLQTGKLLAQTNLLVKVATDRWILTVVSCMDRLPAERERGITIQSAAISFDWGWHNNRSGDDYEANDSVAISLIDNPGHIDFSGTYFMLR